ncbi:hypothetical protein [Rhodococcus phenolicus]|uniref:hypothetical protein n=1 Tax=Rhodococcus phenolicus TaxID=263849 RepID=UPI00082B43F1|nr:hypothetical protein [Rhodococcus phenolicus]
MTALGSLLTGLCDDAALFPPGNAPLEQALPAHAGHRVSDYTDLVGLFVFPVPRIDELTSVLEARPFGGELALSVTAPGGPATVPAAVARLRELDGVTVDAVEIAVPADHTADEFLTALDTVAAVLPDVSLFVEVPRDDRRAALLAGLAGTAHAAKFRTGGVVAEAYPDETELAEAIRAAVTLGVPFKATAGLHHAVRNTDPHTGFEQHGFVNVLAAVDAALDGADVAAIAAVLAERDGTLLAARLSALSASRIAEVRSRFRSFGTCSILEPLVDLVDLGLVPATVTPIIEGSPA